VSLVSALWIRGLGLEYESRTEDIFETILFAREGDPEELMSSSREGEGVLF